MKSKEQLLLEISNLLGVKQFTRKTVMNVSKERLENILTGLENWKEPKDFKLKGEAPRLQDRPSEAETGYRYRMSRHIQNNTKIYVPPISKVTARFYNAIVIHLDLYQ